MKADSGGRLAWRQAMEDRDACCGEQGGGEDRTLGGGGHRGGATEGGVEDRGGGHVVENYFAYTISAFQAAY